MEGFEKEVAEEAADAEGLSEGSTSGSSLYAVLKSHLGGGQQDSKGDDQSGWDKLKKQLEALNESYTKMSASSLKKSLDRQGMSRIVIEQVLKTYEFLQQTTGFSLPQDELTAVFTAVDNDVHQMEQHIEKLISPKNELDTSFDKRTQRRHNIKRLIFRMNQALMMVFHPKGNPHLLLATSSQMDTQGAVTDNADSKIATHRREMIFELVDHIQSLDQFSQRLDPLAIEQLSEVELMDALSAKISSYYKEGIELSIAAHFESAVIGLEGEGGIETPTGTSKPSVTHHTTDLSQNISMISSQEPSDAIKSAAAATTISSEIIDNEEKEKKRKEKRTPTSHPSHSEEQDESSSHQN